MNNIALIPARSGSKRLPNKNLRKLNGKTLIERSVSCAMKSGCFEKIVISSDDRDIIDEAVRNGAEAPFIRPAELATDTATSASVVLHAIQHIGEASNIMLLQPTSPLRLPCDIIESFRLFLGHEAHSLVSVSTGIGSTQNLFKLHNNHLHQLNSINPGNKVALPGAIYLFEVNWFKKYAEFIREDTLAYRMPEERSIDIDTLDEFESASKFLNQFGV